MAAPSFCIGLSAMKRPLEATEKELAKAEKSVVDELSDLKLDDNAISRMNDSLNAEIESVDVDEMPSRSQVIVSVQGKEPFEFLEEDPSFQQRVAEGGSNPSASVDRWARNRLQKFRTFKKWDCTVPFDDLPAAECSSILMNFFEQTVKKDGSLYPSQTLMSLYRAFHRMLRRKQDMRVQETGIEEPAFSMRANPLFKPVGVSCVLAMERSRRGGANLPRKKAAVISLQDEQTILSHFCTSPSHPRGLQRRVVFYSLCRFAIRGGLELHTISKHDFEFGSDEAGAYLRYDERLSKNYRVSLDRYQEEHFRPAVTEHDEDMISTVKSLIDHLPVSGTFLFYQCIDNPRSHAWYSTLRVSVKRLTGCLKEIHRECGLDVEAVSNKSGRTTCVTRMSTEGVPPEVGMKITGHKSQGGYNRYNRATDALVRAAQRTAGEGSAYATNVVQETELFKTKVLAGREVEDDLSPSKKAKLQTEGIRENSPVGAVHNISGATAVIVRDCMSISDQPQAEPQPVAVLPVESKVDDDDNWLEGVDWEEYMREFDKGRNYNSIKAVLGGIGSLTKCTLNINIGGNVL